MNRDEAKTILLLYRPGAEDAGDPDVAAALALAREDPELTRWLVEHCARQEALRAGFRRIAAPAGLKEQIISEQAARKRPATRRPAALLAAAVLAVVLVVLIPWWLQHQARTELAGANTYPVMLTRMASVALRPYGMDLLTNSPAAVQEYLAKKQAPADYILPAPLEKVAVVGCAVEDWHGVRVSMICFRTGRPAAPGQQSDLWLFVVDRSHVKNAPLAGAREFNQISRLATMTWTVGDKLYVLGTEGDEQALRPYL